MVFAQFVVVSLSSETVAQWAILQLVSHHDHFTTTGCLVCTADHCMRTLSALYLYLSTAPVELHVVY